jgi:hypothetical protein
LKAFTAGNKSAVLHITINVCGLETLKLTSAGQKEITFVTDPNQVNSVLLYDYVSWYEMDTSNPASTAVCSVVTQYWLSPCDYPETYMQFTDEFVYTFPPISS